ncbi:hypothetical protein GTP23_00760 [Pseudoduganella sp. FT93W]|uniref:Uncharacterized protein n=1 Tax=Duganella fentianensis TaxID=2692177 RepID=A0A845HVK7_9BURK|nr:hypothetical protein [Duganella fentianensis]MYN43595.1 hypothetical protein [Duganella fentianensis]
MSIQPEMSREQLAQLRALRSKESLHDALERARKATYAATVLAARDRARQDAIRRMHTR